MFVDTPLIMIEDDEGVQDLVKRLSASPVIGIDTESDSMYSYQEKVCLIQFSDAENDYIVDPLKKIDLAPLAPVMSNPDIVKVLHGADYDISCLNRDYGFEIRGLFDTLIAAQLLGMPRVGLADLIGRFFGWEIDKQFQRHDWGRRPLRPAHLDYARGDTHWLLALRELLIRKLERVGRYDHLVEECRILEKREPAPPKPFDPNDFVRVKGSKGLDDKAMRILRKLYVYRDGQARSLNRPTFKVIPDSALVTVAKKQPKDLTDLDKLFSSRSSMRRRHGEALVQCVQDGLEDDTPLPKPNARKSRSSTPKKRVKTRLNGRQAERALGELKNWRNTLIDGDNRHTPYNVVSNSQLKAIAHARPLDLEELAQLPDIRDWQVEEFGAALLSVLDEVDPRES